MCKFNAAFANKYILAIFFQALFTFHWNLKIGTYSIIIIFLLIDNTVAHKRSNKTRMKFLHFHVANNKLILNGHGGRSRF